MRKTRWIASLLALLALAITAAVALADTTLFKDDAEGAIDAAWTVGQPKDSKIQPWQKSDSSATKIRSSASHGGATSYWSGSSPQDFQAQDVVQGDSTLTLKQPLQVPADGTTTVDFWSLFLNEGDDQGLVEASTTLAGPWKKVAAVKLEASDVTNPAYTPGYCDPAHPADTATTGFEEIKGTLGAYAGQKVYLRFNLKYGTENRAATQPCGWWIDDIAVTTTGTPGSSAPAVTPPTTTAPAAKPTVKFTKLKGKGKKANLSLTVAGSDIKNLKVTILKGKKTVGTGKAVGYATGTHVLPVRFKKAYKKGKYTVKLAGVASDGSKVTAKGSVKGS